MRTTVLIVVIAAFVALGAIDIAAGQVRLGLASLFLAAVNYLFLTA